MPRKYNGSAEALRLIFVTKDTSVKVMWSHESYPLGEQHWVTALARIVFSLFGSVLGTCEKAGRRKVWKQLWLLDIPWYYI